MRRNQYKNAGSGTTCHTTKGYPRVTAGPLRHKYIHRVVAAALIGRELSKDIQVHHMDGNKLNFHHSNLLLMGEKDHGWVSAKQAWFMRDKDSKEKQEWDKFMEEQYKAFVKEVAQAKASKMPWQNSHPDGHLSEQWQDR